jgi:DNA sulfur modification protein DndD
MKLKSARIRNFKLLRDVRLEFSDDPKRPLTVVRAENGSGKTSTLMALRWALYGQGGLDDATMRLSPTTWPDDQDCEISVQLDFSHTLYSLIAGESVGTSKDYRLVRTVTERPHGDSPNRGQDKVVLYEYTDAGLDKIEPPDLKIGEMLPREMQHIFFTDGDAALTFISPQLSKASRRDQVREAIRSLLGLGLLEGASAHIASARRRYNTEVSRASQSNELAEVTRKLSEAEDALTRSRDRERDVERQVEDLARRYEEADKKLQLALQAGDYDELAEQRARADAQQRAARDNERPLKQRHQQLLQDDRLSLALMGSKLQDGFAELAKLHDAGVIPSGSLPVLEERLELEECICKTPLKAGSDARRNVEELIARQRTVDDKRKILTELHHAAKVDLQRGATALGDWKRDLEDLEVTRLNNRKAMQAASEELQILNEKIDRIDKISINEVRKDRDSLQAALTEKQDELRDLQVEIDSATATIAELTPKQAQLLRQDQKLGLLTSRLTVTEDMASVVQGALQDLQQIYLGKVSERMNGLFLEMVGADPASMEALAASDGGPRASGVFSSASLTPTYEIVVHSGEKTLNPEHELNGASKRALTFSFIWALTEVSQVVAPRIIDTPLGMMSGLVKKRVIELITAPANEASDVEKQVVLFLTRDEIRGIEAVLDERAGRVFTLTNTDHYPIDLVNDPGSREPTIVQCECNHRQFCAVCARKNDSQYELIERPVV